MAEELSAAAETVESVDDATADDEGSDDDTDDDDETDGDETTAGEGEPRRRRRRRGGRRRRRGGDNDDSDSASDDTASDDTASEDTDAAIEPVADDDAPTTETDAAPAIGEPSDAGDGESGEDDDSGADGDADGDGSRRRRRRRRRRGEDAGIAPDDPTEVVVRVREPRRGRRRPATRSPGSTGRPGWRPSGSAAAKVARPAVVGRRSCPRPSSWPAASRSNRKMIIRQRDDLSQIAVIEDDILVEHYVDRDSAASLIGNVYLGRVQNVLPSMEAAFIDIGRGRNAVLYAGEVDWDSFGAEGQNRKVEKVLKSGQTILVQVTKDPVGAKGARLTNHVSIPGRYIVYAPGGHLSGISRKLPDNERKRLKDILVRPGRRVGQRDRPDRGRGGQSRKSWSATSTGSRRSGK